MALYVRYSCCFLWTIPLAGVFEGRWVSDCKLNRLYGGSYPIFEAGSSLRNNLRLGNLHQPVHAWLLAASKKQDSVLEGFAQGRVCSYHTQGPGFRSQLERKRKTKS